MRNDENIAPIDARDRFAEYLERASETVRGWPLWKQAVLGNIQLIHTSSQTYRASGTGCPQPAPDEAGDS